MQPKNYQCPLGQIQPKKLDPEKIKRKGWLEDGILVINLKTVKLAWNEKELLKTIGNKLYGKKKEKNYEK